MTVRRLLPFVLPLAACAPRGAATPAPAPAPVPAPVAPPPVVAPAAPRPAGTVQGVVDSIAESPAVANAHWGVLIVDPRRGDTLAIRRFARYQVGQA